jgi:ubiquinone/menaquinone biosynthesis C-methylase UbiE
VETVRVTGDASRLGQMSAGQQVAVGGRGELRAGGRRQLGSTGLGLVSRNDASVTRDSFSHQPLETVVSRYDRVAPWYRFGEWTILLAPGFRRRAVACIGLQPGERVVEIGCGTGRNLALLRDAVGSEGHVIGVDASAGMLAQAQKVISRHGWENVTLACEDAAELTLDEPVDAAYFSLSYSALPERAPVLDRAWEAVRPGGRLVIMDAGIPDTRLGRALAPLAEIVATLFPGDPYSQPWADLARISDSVTVERFEFDLYFVCTARKPQATEDHDGAQR